MTLECFDVRHEDGVAVLTLKRPAQLNSMIPAFWRELPEIVRGLDADAGARDIVLASTGKHFCAGMDLAVFAGGMGVPSQLETGRQREFLRRLVLHLQDVISSVEQV